MKKTLKSIAMLILAAVLLTALCPQAIATESGEKNM